MIYDLKKEYEYRKLSGDIFLHYSRGELVELKVIKDTRTLRQNRALHKFFTIISDNLNDLGISFCYSGINNNEFEIPHTPNIVKEFIWKPIQLSMFDIESTTKINTTQINKITDVIVKYFGEKGIVIEFPSLESLYK